jgi:hypothetical protein
MRAVVAGTAALGVLAGAMTGVLAGASTAAAAAGDRDGDGIAYERVERIGPGVEYRQFSVAAAHGTVHVHLLAADLRNSRVRLDLLTPGHVAQRQAVSGLADARSAVGAVNGDFFDIAEDQHPGVPATGSSVGPEIGSGRELKAAVPDGQRFGPAMPPGGTTRDILGLGADRRLRLDRLDLRGSVRTPDGRVPLGGFNQYALPVDGIGAYTADWGTVSRRRAVCGTDTSRGAPCSTDTYEVTVRQNRVTAVDREPGAGRIPAGSTVLLGRDAGAEALRTLRVGDRADVDSGLAPAYSPVPYVFAIGGFPVLRDGQPLAGLDNRTAATRTAAGFDASGRTLYLLALDGSAESGAGLTIAELASVMRKSGADSALNLDGGGSTTLVARDPGAHAVTVRNHPSAGAERPVPNAIGVFSRA